MGVIVFFRFVLCILYFRLVGKLLIYADVEKSTVNLIVV